jgi:hypothetical protein
METPAAPAEAAEPVLAGTSALSALLPAWQTPGASETYSAWVHAWGLGQPTSTLEGSLLLLLAVCQAGSWGAAAVLYGSDVSSLLEQLCYFADPGVQLITQKLYRYASQLEEVDLLHLTCCT